MTAPLGFLMQVTGRHILSGAIRVFYFANFAFTTTPTDTPANQVFDATITQAFDSTRSVFAPGTTSGRSVVQRGDVVIDNTGGAYDYLKDYAFGGRAVTLWCGERTGVELSDFDVMFSGTTDQPDISTKSVTFHTRDAKAPFDANVQATKYANNGDPLEGGADLAGKPKPVLFGGPAENFAPPCVDALREIYQVHDGAIVAVTDVRNQGAALTNSGTYASRDDLLDDEQAPVYGHYKSWFAGGMVRINTAAQAKQITMSAIQSTLSHAQVFRALAHRIGLTDDDLVLSDLAILDMQSGTAVELWLGTTDVAAKDVADQIAVSAGCGWGARNSDGKIRLVRIDKPAAPVAATFTQFDSPADQPLKQESTSDKERGKPAFSVRVDYAKNYTVQQGTDLVDGVDADTREFLKQATRSVVAADATVATAFLDAVEVPVPSILVFGDAAQAEADRVLALRKRYRFRFTLTVFYTRETAALDLFDVVGVRYNRFGLGLAGRDDGEPMLVLGVAPNAKARTIALTLWGATLTVRNLAAYTDALLRTYDGKYLVTYGR